MGWFGPSGDCGCCGGCWECSFLAGVDITWDTTTLNSCDCDFPTTGALRQGNSSRWFDDGLGADDDAITECFARWDFAKVCCADNGDGTYDFAVLVYWVIIDLYNTPARTVKVSVFSGRQIGTITGSGTGDPCTKDWTLFRTSHGTGAPPNETIDGWTMGSIKWARVIIPHDHSYSSCPSAASTQNIVGGTQDVQYRPSGGFPVPLPIAYCTLPTNLDVVA